MGNITGTLNPIKKPIYSKTFIKICPQLFEKSYLKISGFSASGIQTWSSITVTEPLLATALLHISILTHDKN